MKTKTLLGQLLVWQVAVTAVACALLVGSTIIAGRMIIRHGQDRALASLADTLCFGIEFEQMEHYPELDTRTAAAHFFEESHIEDYQFELWERDGDALVRKGEFDELPMGRSLQARGCRSVGALRACRRECEEGFLVRVAAPDVLRSREVKSLSLTLAIAFLGALSVGALVGRMIVRRLLRPVHQLRDATSRLRIAPTMTLDVGAEPEELAQLEGAFDALLQRLATMLERERRFAPEASHELRTPLTNLRLRLERIHRQAAEHPDLCKQIDAAIRNVDSLDRLTANLLTLARSELAEMPVDEINLCDVAREAVPTEDRDSRRIQIDLPDDVVVRGNAELLVRAVGNLLENARKYAGPEAEIHLKVHAENGAGVIAVEDDGPGIPPEIREHVFDRFFRGPLTRSRVGGDGLGLSVAEAIAKRHGGTIEAGASELGGESVRIRIPLFSAVA